MVMLLAIRVYTRDSRQAHAIDREVMPSALEIERAKSDGV